MLFGNACIHQNLWPTTVVLLQAKENCELQSLCKVYRGGLQFSSGDVQRKAFLCSLEHGRANTLPLCAGDFVRL